MFQQVSTILPVHTTDGVLATRSRPVVPRGNRSKTKHDIQARQRAWLREICESTGLKPTQLATGAQTSRTTLTRFLNDQDYTGTLAPETIERIKTTYKVPGPEEYASKSRSPLIGLSEASRFDPGKERGDLAAIVAAILHGRRNVEPWRIKTMALDSAGYLPGDIVFVETLVDNQQAKPQDAVCAQVADYQHGSAETVFRIWDPPFLVAAAHDRTGYKPLLVDGQRVRIFGVIRESYRPHSLSLTR